MLAARRICDFASHGAKEHASACFLYASSGPEGGNWKQKAVSKARLNRFNFLRKIGAGEEIRTLDPNLGKVVLYH
jgi:hypothetical protein